MIFFDKTYPSALEEVLNTWVKLGQKQMNSLYLIRVLNSDNCLSRPFVSPWQVLQIVENEVLTAVLGMKLEVTLWRLSLNLMRSRTEMQGCKFLRIPSELSQFDGVSHLKSTINIPFKIIEIILRNSCLE